MNDPLITESENNEMTEMPDKEFKNIILNRTSTSMKKKNEDKWSKSNLGISLANPNLTKSYSVKYIISANTRNEKVNYITSVWSIIQRPYHSEERISEIENK